MGPVTAARRTADRLGHMLGALNAIERLAWGKTLTAYRADPDLEAAIERYLERLSEASRHVPNDLKERHPEVDWRGVADIGNALRHAYDQLSDHRIWQVVTDELPSLRSAVEGMIAEIAQGDQETET